MIANQLTNWLLESLRNLGGRGSIIEICKYIWAHHKNELEDLGDIFYTWQYDIRWIATNLRKSGKLNSVKDSPKGVWVLRL